MPANKFVLPIEIQVSRMLYRITQENVSLQEKAQYIIDMLSSSQFKKNIVKKNKRTIINLLLKIQHMDNFDIQKKAKEVMREHFVKCSCNLAECFQCEKYKLKDRNTVFLCSKHEALRKRKLRKILNLKNLCKNLTDNILKYLYKE